MSTVHRTTVAQRPIPACIAAVLAAAFLHGCGTMETVKETIKEKFDGGGVIIPRLAPVVPPPPPDPRSSIRPDVDCKIPEENFDFGVTLQQRLGAEGAARLKALLSSDFKSSDLSPADRELLRKYSKEVVWMPAIIEQWIGRLLFFSGGSNIKSKPRTSFTEPEWDQATKSMGRLLGVAPQMPFEVRLMLIENGDTGSLAGGLVLLDERTMSGSTDPSQTDKLNFVAAHELAHIYKRHRAKRIQQLLVDSDSGLELMRKSFEMVKNTGGSSSLPAGGEFAEMAAWFRRLFEAAKLGSEQIEALRKHNAAYEQDQEFEADMCATSMLIRSGVGDPLRGFRLYRSDQQESAMSVANSGTSKVYQSHPPNTEREKRILSKINLSASPSASPAPRSSSPTPAAPPRPPRTKQ